MNKPGFTILELMITLSVLGVLLSLGTVNGSSMLERWQVQQAQQQVLSVLEQAQWLALKQQQRHRIRIDEQNLLLIQETPSQSLETHWDTLPENIQTRATSWPSFSAFGFAGSGSIFVESENYTGRIVVSSMGRIRTEPIEAR